MSETPRGETGAGATPPPTTEEEFMQLQLRLNEQVLERAAADPQWRRKLIDEPETAMAEVPEYQQVSEYLDQAERQKAAQEAEVEGHYYDHRLHHHCFQQCVFQTVRWQLPIWSYQGG